MGIIGALKANALGAVALATLGCKVNQAESDEFERGFRAAGLKIVEFHQPADAYVINCCTVTHIADRKSRQLLRQAKRANPDGVIVATGCYATAGSSTAQPLQIDIVVPNDQKSSLVDLVLRELGRGTASAALPAERDRTRAFVKVQDGCDGTCSYCVIPRMRGRERSVAVDSAVAAVRDRLAAGHKEIVLTGVHLGTYGKGLDGSANLCVLLNRILDETDAQRIRISSIEPWDFDAQMLGLWSTGRFCRHFHLALQSGSDAVLQLMRRPYDLAGYRRLLDVVRSRVPDVAVTTDIIVGFPGETATDFVASLRAVEELGFAGVHVFPYSPRQRTAALHMSDQVPNAVKRERVGAMLVVGAEAARRFRRQFAGRALPVLFEQCCRSEEAGEGLWTGLTDNYIRVVARTGRNVANTIVATRLVELGEGDVMRGEIVP